MKQKVPDPVGYRSSRLKMSTKYSRGGEEEVDTKQGFINSWRTPAQKRLLLRMLVVRMYLHRV